MINIGILAHVDAGKTTLTECMLHISGAIRRAGSVDTGDAHTDNLPVERERGISVRACSARFTYRNTEINLIDTPGHADFSGEIERSLRALDNAVLVLSAVEGIQPQTEAIWRALNVLRIPVFFFINKTDRTGADVNQVIQQIRTRFSVTPFFTDAPVSACLYTTTLLEALAENNLAMMERYLTVTENIQSIFTEEEVLTTLRAQFAARQIFPLISGTALGGIGVDVLMDWITAAAKPADTDADGELSALAYRIEHHPSLGRLAHVRMFGGAVAVRDTVINTTKNKQEKIAQIKKYSGVRLVDAARLAAGDCGIICGLSESGVGDIYGSPAFIPQSYAMTQPLMAARVYPKDENEYPRLLSATRELNAEDPLLNMIWERDQRELVLSVTGLMQIEILQNLYQTRFGLTVNFGSPTVIYKETPSCTAEGFEAYTMPKPCWAIIRFIIDPLPPGSGFVYESKVGPDTLPARYQAQITQALPSALMQGPKGWEVTDLRVTLVGGESHVYHTHPLDFIVATPMALMNGLVNAGTDLLEPYLAFTLTAPDHLSAKLLGEITLMRGRYDDTRMENGLFTVSGVYPLAEGMDFPRRIAVITSGRGVLGTRFHHYEKCPSGFSCVQPYRGVSPLDRAKYILHIRHAL